MIVTGKHLHRRTFLRGMGAAIALPMLDAMTPAFAAAARLGKPSLRLGFTYVPNGISMVDWTPKGEGLGFEYSRIMKPLEAFRKDTVVLSGLAHRNGNALGDGPGDHARAAASYLTGVHPRKTAGADIQNGISVDQIAAQHLAPNTRFASLELGCDDSRTVGNCDSGYWCAYTNSIAWRGPATPMPPGTEPAPRLRAAVRRRRHEPHARGRAPGACVPQEHPRSRRRADDAALRGSRSDGSAQARRVPDVDPRDRAAHREGREGPDGPRRRTSTSRPAFRCSTPSTST